MRLSAPEIIFGLQSRMKHELNFCILHAKWFIHLKKQEDHNVCFANFICYLKNVFIIEKQIAINKKSLPHFKATFANCLASIIQF